MSFVVQQVKMANENIGQFLHSELNSPELDYDNRNSLQDATKSLESAVCLQDNRSNPGASKLNLINLSKKGFVTKQKKVVSITKNLFCT